MENKQFQTMVLRELGATTSEVEELLIYNENVFKKLPETLLSSIPMEDELFVSAWEGYVQEANLYGVFPVLQEKLVQLQFPIREGISKTENYRKATLRGASTLEMPEAIGLRIQLEAPDRMDLMIHQTPAGNIPVIIVEERNDFVRIVQALTSKNEPTPIPDSVGAVMVAGYNNWDRIWNYKKTWKEKNTFENWSDEFKRLVANKALYQDRFIILSTGYYNGISANDLQLSESEWRNLSLIIRREHEVTHYFTERILGSMCHNMLDELIADYIGIVSAFGEYKADLFLRFIGLENFPHCRSDGRIHSYRSSLSDGAFHILQILLVNAAKNLEQLNSIVKDRPFGLKEKANLICVLSHFTLEELASVQGLEELEKTLNIVIT